MWDRQAMLGRGRGAVIAAAARRAEVAAPGRKRGPHGAAPGPEVGGGWHVCPQSPSGLCTTTSRTGTADGQAVNITSKLVQEKQTHGHCNKAYQSGNSQDVYKATSIKIGNTN